MLTIQFDYYCGISRDIAQRQRQHNKGKPGEQGNRKMRAALAGRAAGTVVKAKRLVSFGKTGLSECPQPLLHVIETVIICCGRLTTSPTSIQINIVDTPPYVPPSRPKKTMVNTSKGQVLATVWQKLYEYYRVQQNDLAKGKYMRYGCRPVPVGIDGKSIVRGSADDSGISRAEYEAKKIIIPIIRNEKMGKSWVYSNLFKTEIFEKDGEMREESPYAELQQAKLDYPIPAHAFYVSKNVSLTNLWLSLTSGTTAPGISRTRIHEHDVGTLRTVVC